VTGGRRSGQAKLPVIRLVTVLFGMKCFTNTDIPVECVKQAFGRLYATDRRPALYGRLQSVYGGVCINKCVKPTNIECIMEMQNVKEHLLCYDYDNSDRPTIENRTIEKNTSWEICAEQNKLIFLMAGKVSTVVGDFERKEVAKGYFWFVSAGQEMSIRASSSANAQILILRFSSNMPLCDCYIMEQLYSEFRKTREGEEVDVRQLHPCVIRPMLSECLRGLFITTLDGLCCRSFFQVKVKEVFFLLRAYYPKRELYCVFHPLLTVDILFSDRVKNSWKNYPTVEALARSMNMTPSGFYKRFVAIFGQSPLDWITEEKKKAMYKDIVSNKLSLGEVAKKWNFANVKTMSYWCKQNYGNLPSAMRKHAE
jgi:AraC-like DNA-binding protein